MQQSNFQLVSAMNTAFGNPRGNYLEPLQGDKLTRVHKQVKNILDEFGETLVALGHSREAILGAKLAFWREAGCRGGVPLDTKKVRDGLMDTAKVRDGLIDILVFTYGAHHLMGWDANQDMRSVIKGVMTRFIKDDADKAATIAKHAAAGVTDVYFEGDYPKMIMKSGSDQPDAPKGKFLKSASYQEEVLADRPINTINLMAEDSDDMLRSFAAWFVYETDTDFFQSLSPEEVEVEVNKVLRGWSKTFGRFVDISTHAATTVPSPIDLAYRMFKAGLKANIAVI